MCIHRLLPVFRYCSVANWQTDVLVCMSSAAFDRTSVEQSRLLSMKSRRHSQAIVDATQAIEGRRETWLILPGLTTTIRASGVEMRHHVLVTWNVLVVSGSAAGAPGQPLQAPNRISATFPAAASSSGRRASISSSGRRAVGACTASAASTFPDASRTGTAMALRPSESSSWLIA
ncbi:hypothetical protein D3C86_1398960 [compost metagenome]